MNVDLIEEKLSAAFGIDANAINCTIILLFNDAIKATEAFKTMLEELQPYDLTLHARYNSHVDLSIISTQTGDSINVNNLTCSPMTSSHFDLISSTMKYADHPDRDYITLGCGVIGENGMFELPYFSELNVIGLANIKNLTMEFIK